MLLLSEFGAHSGCLVNGDFSERSQLGFMEDLSPVVITAYNSGDCMQPGERKDLSCSRYSLTGLCECSHRITDEKTLLFGKAKSFC